MPARIAASGDEGGLLTAEGVGHNIVYSRHKTNVAGVFSDVPQLPLLTGRPGVADAAQCLSQRLVVSPYLKWSAL